MIRDYDVIIVGAGIVGLSLACALRQTGLRIAIIEGQDLWQLSAQTPKDDFSPRVSAISPSSQRLFSKLGVWAAMQSQRLTPYYDMRVWDGLGGSELHFSSFAHGLPALGYLIENPVMQSVLIQTAIAADHIELFMPLRGQQIERKLDHMCLHLTNGTSLRAPLVVGADGPRSWVREHLAFDLVEKPYQQTAIVATVKTTKAHAHTAWQCFLPTGPLAFLPLSEPHTSSIVWSSDLAHSDSLLAMSEAKFNQALTQGLQQRLGEARLLSQRYSFPLVYRHVKHYAQAGCVLIGDAAHTIHPLAGQGMNLGLLDAACLADIIIQAHQQQKPFASLRQLKRFHGWRRGHNQVIALAMQGFKRMFSLQQSCVIASRNRAINCLQQQPFVKQAMIDVAIGRQQNLPSLMQISGKSGG